MKILKRFTAKDFCGIQLSQGMGNGEWAFPTEEDAANMAERANCLMEAREKEFLEGCEVVYGVSSQDPKASFWDGIRNSGREDGYNDTHTAYLVDVRKIEEESK